MWEISNIGMLTALAAGAVSFLSPCVLPLVPGYLSYVAGRSSPVAGNSAAIGAGRLSTLFLSACFVLGFSTVFVALGAGATAISQFLLAYRYETNIIGGATIIVFGALTTGLFRPRWLQRDMRFHGTITGGSSVGAYLLGLAFGFGWTPCIGPVLGAILAVSAFSSTAADGIALLGIYSLGLGVPFLLTAVFTARVSKALSGLRRAGRILHVTAGVVMIIMGVAMVTGTMSNFSFWLLNQFPLLSKMG